MGSIEYRPRKHRCSQCEKSQKRSRGYFCPIKQKLYAKNEAHLCNMFKRKWKDAIAGEVKTTKADPSDIEKYFI